MEVLIRVVFTIVWCSTIVRYTSGDGDLIKKSCQNKNCENISNPFELIENDSKAAEKKSPDFVQKPADLFHEVVETPDFKRIIEVYDNGFYSSLCWVEITTVTEFKNGSNSAKREYAISFESPSNIPDKYLTKKDKADTLSYKIFDQDTQKSEVVNFTTTQTNDNETVRQHKKILCGSGPIYTKEYIEWLNSNKRKVELRVSPKEQHLVANVCGDVKENGASTVSDVTLRQETLSDLPRTNKAGHLMQLSAIKKSKNLPNGSNSVQPQTKAFSDNETTSINLRLGSKGFSTDGDMETSEALNVGSSGKMTSKEPITDKMIEPSRRSEVENDFISTEKSATSTEAASSSSEEYSNFATSKNLTVKPQMISTRAQDLTTTFEDPSSATTNIKSETGKGKEDLKVDDEKSTEKTKLLEEFRTTHTMSIPKSNSKLNKSKLSETSSPLVTISDNSKEIQSTTLNSILSTLSTEDNVAVTEVPISTPFSHKPINVNTPKSPENITLSTTEKSQSTSSVQKIPQTTLEEKYVSTSRPENFKITFTDYQPNSTQTPQNWNAPSNVSSPIELNKEDFEKLNISLNDTSDRISFRMNFLTDYIVEGSKNGKRYRYVTPIIGVEKKVKFNSNFTKQALGLLKTELGYNWDKFIENLIQQFFNNGTNEGPDSFGNGKVNACKDMIGSKPTWDMQPPNLPPNQPPYMPPYPPQGLLPYPPQGPPSYPPQDPPPNPSAVHNAELAYNKLSSMNFDNDFANSNQQDNNPYLMFQNQNATNDFNRPQQNYDLLNTFTYPPFRKLENDSKEPLYRLSSASGPEYATTNFSSFLLPSSSNFENLGKKTTSLLLQRILNSNTTPLFEKSDGTKENGKNVGYRVNSFVSHRSNQFENNKPRFGYLDFINNDSTKSRNALNSTHWNKWITINSEKVQVDKTNEEVPMPGKIKKMFGLFSASFPGN